MTEESFSDDMIKIQEYAMNILEMKNNGVTDIPIDLYIEVLDFYIEALYAAKNYYNGFSQLVEVCTKYTSSLHRI